MTHPHHVAAVTPARRTAARRALAFAVSLALAIGWLLVHPLTAVADGPTTFSNTASIAIPATGSANQIGPASPYPSSITVSGMTGLVTDVTVTFHNLTHATLGDVDALVVAPSGENLIVLSDAGPENALSFTNNATLTFDDSAATTVPGGNVASGSFRPTNNPWNTTETFPAPAPSPSSQTTLAGAFSGIGANGSWQLFIIDDTTGDVGTMSGGWSLTLTTEVSAEATTTNLASSDTTTTTGSPVTFTAAVRAGGSPVTNGSVQFSSDGTNLGATVPVNGAGNATLTTSALAEGTHLIRATYGGATGFLTSNGTLSQRVDNATTVTGTTFCNAGPLTTPDRGAATPYPSNVFVTGLTGQVTKVTAQLRGLSHQAPIDLDILLSGPTPTRNVFLMSDSGGQSAVSTLDLTFDDDAPSAIGSSLTSGTFRPTRTADESVESLPPPAPALSGATTLSTFNGASGNGTWSLWLVDDATGDAGSISGGWCVTITTAAPTTTALTASPNPSTFGQSVTFSATVTSGGNPVEGGSVQFSDGATDLGAPVTVGPDGTATLSTSALTAGSHTITADYGGTLTLAESTDSVDQVVARLASDTVLTSSLNPSRVGDPVTLTATVTAGGSPLGTGSVTFSVDGTDVATAPVSATGEATFTTGTLTAGTHPVQARYLQTATHATSSDDLDQVVGQQASTTTVTSNLNPADFGEPVTLTASVTAGGAPVTAGSVQFSVGGTPAGPAVALAPDGTATLTQTGLLPGSIVFTATYLGTSDIAGSSGTVTQVINGQPSATLLTGPATSELGDPVTFTATVTAGGAPVTSGSVVFRDAGTPLSGEIGVDDAGLATFTTSELTVGAHTLTAAYTDADGSYQASASSELVHTVTLTFAPGGPYTVAEGEALTLAGNGSPGATYAWDLNDDGDFGDATGLAPTLSWDELQALGINDGPASHTVRLQASAGGVAVGTQPAQLTVSNTAPQSVLTGGLTATVGRPFTIKVGADDPSAADLAAMFVYTVDWGDGSPVESVVGPADPPVTHTYTTAGTFDATFTATDKDGGTGPGQTVQVLADDAPAPSPSPTNTSDTDDDNGSNDLPQTGADADLNRLFIGFGFLAVGALATATALITRAARRQG